MYAGTRICLYIYIHVCVCRLKDKPTCSVFHTPPAPAPLIPFATRVGLFGLESFGFDPKVP